MFKVQCLKFFCCLGRCSEQLTSMCDSCKFMINKIPDCVKGKGFQVISSGHTHTDLSE